MINGLRDGLRTLPYVGGKSNFAGPGKWIADILDTVQVETYVEPCMGTLGILLRREPSKIEVCNDLDGRIVNFFRVVRDKPDEFAQKLSLTAYRSEQEFIWAKQNLYHSDAVMAAVACFVILRNSIPASLIERSCYKFSGNDGGHWDFPDDIFHLAERLRDVRFKCGDAIDLIQRYSLRKDTLIYIDPPYPETLGYDCVFDGELMMDTVGNSESYVAVSGFNDSWTRLEGFGFLRLDRPIHLQMDTSKTGKRVESLYVNWNYESEPLMPSLFDV